MWRCADRSAGLFPIRLIPSLLVLSAGLARAADAWSPPANLTVWDKSLEVRTGVGYKDNVLLGAVTQEGSAFETTGLDLILLRLSTSGTLFHFFLSGDDTRYFQARDVDREQSLIAQAELDRDFNADWKGSMKVQYFYQNQMLDASISDTNLSTVKARGHNVSAHPSVRRNLAGSYWLGWELGVQRQWFAAPLQSYWQGGPKFSLGRDWARQANLTLSYSLNRRGYDHFEQIALDGTSIPGSDVAFWQHEAELAWQRTWDRSQRWRTTTRLIYAINEDNGPGFFNYHDYRLVQQLRYRRKPWQIEGRAAVSRYEFDRQTVSATDLSKRRKTDVTFGLRGERTLFKTLKAFADYQYERSLSNLTFDDYQVNQVTVGVDWEF